LDGTHQKKAACWARAIRSFSSFMIGVFPSTSRRTVGCYTWSSQRTSCLERK
jgi:hypothetical protein